MAEYSTKVVIVGAGIAGVTAATWLVKHGVEDIVLLEAQDYVGGRVKGQVVGGKILDMGAQFVHGRVNNPANDIAEKLHIVAFPDEVGYLETELQNQPDEFLTSKGEKVPKEKLAHFNDFLNKEIYCKETKSDIDENETVGDYFDEAYRKYLEKYGNNLTGEEKELFDSFYRWFCFYELVDNASNDLHDISAWGSAKYKKYKGNRFTDIIGGMTAILRAVADLIPKEIIHLNTPVTKIHWCAAETGAQSNKVRVECKDGNVYVTDHVIVTVSAGCMQANQKELFEPSIPKESQVALEHLRFGGIAKIYLVWNEPLSFMNKDKENTKDYFESWEFLWLDSYPITVESDRCQRKTKSGKPWWYGIQAVETIFDQPNVLEFWLTLEQAEIMETLEDSEVKSVCTEVLKAFFKNIQWPEPVAVYKTTWITNPYIRGTYSYPSRDLRKEDIQHLGKPLPSPENPRVLFAGEAYGLEYISTFHGALQSGQEQANLILKSKGIKTSKRLVDFLEPAKC